MRACHNHNREITCVNLKRAET